MTDEAKALVERLRASEYIAYYDDEPGMVADEELLNEVADRIEALSAENERLVEALTHISNLSPAVTHGWAEEARQIARAALVGDSHD